MKISSLTILFTLLLLYSCVEKKEVNDKPSGLEIMVLGITQDAGYPQINCQKSCCKRVWNDHSLRQMVCSIAILDHQKKEYWIIDATPDFKDQIHLIQEQYPWADMPSGIFLTHAHIGHYTGLMDLGREALGGKDITVFTMPRMKQFLEENGPWSQLVQLNNIKLISLQDSIHHELPGSLKVMPFTVPHRDEYSETVGFRIEGPSKSAIFIPDIDKWEKWGEDILEKVRDVDYALLDGSFYANGEIPGRDMSEIPHPFIEESMTLFDALSPEDRNKIKYIHFNHTNPVLNEKSKEYSEMVDKAYIVSKEGDKYGL